MAKAIRDHARDFIAVGALALIALVIGYIIVQQQRLRIPILEEKPFSLKAEFETAQAVTPGQGQTVRVAGVRIGDISKVELEAGHAVVTMDIDSEFLPIYRDATVLLRPKTGLKDMQLEMDPGSDFDPNSSDDEYQVNDTIPLANTAPDVNLDEILELLDADNRAYLRALLVGGGEGLRGQGKNLGELLGSLGPINRGLARINREVAKRKENLANLIHNLSILTGRIGQEPEQIASLIDSSNSALSAIASQDLNVREAVQRLGPTLTTTEDTLIKVDRLAEVLGPAFNKLRPFARKLDDIANSTRILAEATTGDLKNKIRPFVRSAREPVKDLGPAAASLANATPRLTVIGQKLNRLFNMAAYNPNGAEGPCTPAELPTCTRDEGYLYWAAWLAHVGNSTFQAQDANGEYRKLYLTVTPEQACALLTSTPLAPLVTGLGQLFGPGSPFGGAPFPAACS